MLYNKKLIAILPSKVTRILGLIVALLVLADIGVEMMTYIGGHNFVYGLVPLFDMDSEVNVPTYFSTVILLMAVFLLYIIAVFQKQKGDSYALHWGILTIIFLYLSMDEAAHIHELLSRPTKELFDSGWVPTYAWVIPGGVFVLVFALLYCRFLLHLPAKTRLLFLIAGVLYVGATIGIETVGSRYVSSYGRDNLTYNMIATVEETFEMVGIVLFIYALLDYMRLNEIEIRLRFGSPD